MRVVVASTYVPFIKGGTTVIIDSLEAELRKRRVEVDTVRIPLRSAWFELPEQMLAMRCLDLTQASGQPIDRLITIRYPAYAIPHPNKVNWFIHHHRGAYDLWGTEFQDIPNTELGLHTRQMIMAADTRYLNEAQKTYALTKLIADRLRKFNQIEAAGVLYSPLPDSDRFYCGEQGDYFLYTARLTPLKRQNIAVEAMRYTKGNFKLVLAGTGDPPEYAATLKSLVTRYRLEQKIVFTDWISEAEKIKLTADALATLYVAYDEDGLGYSTLESLHARKPVLTLHDSGGPNEIIQDGVNGLTVPPTPQALAAAMDQLWADKRRTLEMGKAAHQSIAEHGITWDHLIERLLS